MGINGYYKGINPFGSLMGNGYSPLRGYPYTLYPGFPFYSLVCIVMWNVMILMGIYVF